MTWRLFVKEPTTLQTFPGYNFNKLFEKEGTQNKRKFKKKIII